MGKGEVEVVVVLVVVVVLLLLVPGGCVVVAEEELGRLVEDDELGMWLVEEVGMENVVDEEVVLREGEDADTEDEVVDAEADGKELMLVVTKLECAADDEVLVGLQICELCEMVDCNIGLVLVDTPVAGVDGELEDDVDETGGVVRLIELMAGTIAEELATRFVDELDAAVEADMGLDASWLLLELEIATAVRLLLDTAIIVPAALVVLVDTLVPVGGVMLELVLEQRVGTAISVACKQSGGEDVNSMKMFWTEASQKRDCPFPSVKAGLLHASVPLSLHILPSVGGVGAIENCSNEIPELV